MFLVTTGHREDLDLQAWPSSPQSPRPKLRRLVKQGSRMRSAGKGWDQRSVGVFLKAPIHSSSGWILWGWASFPSLISKRVSPSFPAPRSGSGSELRWQLWGHKPGRRKEAQGSAPGLGIRLLWGRSSTWALSKTPWAVCLNSTNRDQFHTPHIPPLFALQERHDTFLSQLI